MLLLPPLESLRFFEAAARHQNFARAGTELGVTPAAVAQRVRGLPQNLWAGWRAGSPSSDPQHARVLAAVQARRCAPPPLRGADGLDGGSAHARPISV